MDYTYQSIILTKNLNSSGSNNVLRYNLNTPLKLPEGTDVSLASLSIPYSWTNISSNFNNNTLSYIFNGSTYNVVFPNGLFSIADLDGYLSQAMVNNGHYLVDDLSQNFTFIHLSVNTVYYRITLTCTPIPTSLPVGYSNPAGITLSGITPQLIVPSTAMRDTIGFDAGTYPGTIGTIYQVNGANVPQVTPIINISVNCNLIASSQYNASPNTIYTFSPNVGFGELINITPPSLIWYKSLSWQFPYIELTFIDQDFRPLEILDNNIVANLYLRLKK